VVFERGPGAGRGSPAAPVVSVGTGVGRGWRRYGQNAETTNGRNDYRFDRPGILPSAADIVRIFVPAQAPEQSV